MTNEPIKVWHCPRCGCELQATGTVESEGETMPVFQCDKCIIKRPIFGEMFSVAFTFAVNAAGQPVDPGDDVIL